MRAPNHNRLPGSLRILCEVAPAFGVSADVCLGSTGLSLFDLHDPGVTVTFRQELTAIENFLRAAPYRPGLGIEVGRHIKPEALGIWGFALLSSPTLRASLATAIDYYQLSFVIARMDLVEQGDDALITFDTTSLPPGIRKFVLERHLTVLLSFGEAQRPGRQFDQSVFRTAEYDAAFARTIERELGMKVEPSRHLNAVVLPRTALDLPLPRHDPDALAVCLKRCESLQHGDDQYSWTARVQDAILADLGNAPSIKSVARTLGLSERTLARRLSEENTSFRAILSTARLAVAHELLSTTTLTVSTVAWRAGYRETSSFVRAFTKAYGMTPGSLTSARRTG
ncbi:MAG: AraC family transcriptional regulator [Marinibacterium sp.]|nr:AraC family transcriptional regulator [Marinibacterium sp.]